MQNRANLSPVMIELKVQCDCGQKYKFDVEPLNGRMPFTVACPVCGVDGTARANSLLREMPAFQTPPPPPVAVAIPAAIPVAPAAAPAVASASAPPRLRVSMPAPAAAPTPIRPLAATGAPPPIGGMGRKPAAAPAAQRSGKPPNFWLGLLGAFIGASVGAGIYFTIYKFTGPIFMLRYVLALGVGGLAGWQANWLSRGEGSKELGGLAAVFTIVGILAAQYVLTLQTLRSNEDISSINETIRDGGYAESVKQAKEVVKALPTGSDAEIRMYIAKQQADEGQLPKPEAISSDEVKQFRNTELTNYLDLASGKLTKEAFWAANGFDPKKAEKVLDTEDKAFTGLAAIMAVFKAGIISMIVAAGLAYKLTTNARGD